MAREATSALKGGDEIDGFRLGERVHGGAMGDIFRVTRPGNAFPLAMKVPHLSTGDSDEGLLNFETEATILPALSGPYIPRFVAAGDFARTPYLVTEWIEGESLQRRLGRGPAEPAETARIGAAIADAVHSLHLQDTVHLDLKPDNIILRPDGRVALIDFGLAHHARFPDLLAEERRLAAGSAPYISPEQVLGERSDPRSDLFALGAVLYELCTGKLPFGVPETSAGMRDRLWLDPVPPVAHAPGVPPWLQEIILRCLEPQPQERYQAAALVAFDLRHPENIQLTARAHRTGHAGFGTRIKRWWAARNERPRPRFLPATLVGAVRVVLVAIDTTNQDDERHPAVMRAVARILSIPADYRLICVSVIAGGPGAPAVAGGSPYLEHLVRLRQWVEPLRLPPNRLSLHVIEAADAAGTLLEFARRNHADLIVLGAPSPSKTRIAWWRSIASSVAASAPCTVHLVRVPGRAEASPVDTTTAASAAPESQDSPASTHPG
jgi:nucleotide-binding universal stress UspA family protein